ncbi:RNA polymerase sigma factor [Stieleria varia]|uniref:RNA polymerase sigma factor n=1 Tax=Stieleria varia TaxID=2528005 RepID=A0A5C6ARY2_9BACT|nr:ECF-type sigma factor [Stieleria varia]TWU02261.1 RNA polymerase sigma factor [Stieleria varia]
MQIRNGDEYAASLLYQRYAHRLIGLIHSKMNGHVSVGTEPEDIVQSVFRSVFGRMKSDNYDAPEGSTLWSLLAVVAVRKLNKNRTYHRAQRRDIGRNVALDEANEPYDSDDNSPDSFAVCLREAMELLLPIEQTVLLLRMDGYNVEEIAKKTKRAKRTVERSFRNIRVRLSESLLQEEPEHQPADQAS